MADGDTRHDDCLGPDPHVMADDGITRRLESVGGGCELRCIRHEGKRKGRDPVVPMPLIAGHDEGSATADRTEAADDQPVDARFGHQIAGTLIEAVAVIIAGIVAVAANNDVGIGDLTVERNAQKRALEVVGHGLARDHGRPASGSASSCRCGEADKRAARSGRRVRCKRRPSGVSDPQAAMEQVQSAIFMMPAG